MTTGNNQLSMMWLITLVIAAAGAWYLDQKIISLFCGLGFLISVMQQVSAVEQPVEMTAQTLNAPIQQNSKVPLYVSSVIAIIGGVLGLSWLVGIGITAWIFFLLRWLQRIEYSMLQLQQIVQHQNPNPFPSDVATHSNQNDQVDVPKNTHPNAVAFTDQIQQWLFHGNPVLKVAIVVLIVGVILLLRFATENWQLSLALKLALIAVASGITVGVGYALQARNRSFALALQGLGLAVLFLDLFFAYYNLVIPSFAIAALLFTVVMATTIYLSLKHESVELALMAICIAYLAPFTLPVRSATVTELMSYYFVINIGVACLSSLRPWKILNQIAFLITAIVGGIYGFIHALAIDKRILTALVLAHSAVFIWLGLRFSQLLVKSDLSQLKLKSLLDIGLIFAAPITAYAFLYLIHFNEKIWQAGLSLLFAAIFALCWLVVRRSQSISFVAQSYFSLMLIFFALIPPILLQQEWSVVGWSIEGVLIYLWSLEKNQHVARYLSIGLLLMAGFSSLYYLVEMNPTPNHIFWVLSLSYLAVVFMSQLKASYQTQLTLFNVSFLSVLSFFASLILALLLQDELNLKDNDVLSLLIVTAIFAVINEIITLKNKSWTWWLPKWAGLIPLMLIAIILVIDHSHQGVIVWDGNFEHAMFAVASLMLIRSWLHLIQSVKLSREALSLGALTSLALFSLCLIPNLPYISMVIVPLLFCLWCFKQTEHAYWKQLWQSKSCLFLMLVWIICSQLFSQQSFQYYVLPILNPFDLVSLGMLVAFIWMLLQQVKIGRDQGLVAVMMVLSLLWLSSYIVLRALHVYLQTPFNTIEVWSNATIQLSLTVLWVLLAFVSMWVATLRKLKPMWVLGGSILVVVTLKLVLLDLSHTGTLTRVISFLLAGGVMLLIAYIAPMPEGEKKV